MQLKLIVGVCVYISLCALTVKKLFFYSWSEFWLTSYTFRFSFLEWRSLLCLKHSYVISYIYSLFKCIWSSVQDHRHVETEHSQAWCCSCVTRTQNFCQPCKRRLRLQQVFLFPWFTLCSLLSTSPSRFEYIRADNIVTMCFITIQSNSYVDDIGQSNGFSYVVNYSSMRFVVLQDRYRMIRVVSN